MTTVAVGNIGIELTALPPFFLQSCNLVDPATPTDPGSGQPTLPPADLWVPIAPTIPEASIPTVTTIVDDSPARIVGCIYDTSSDPQGRLNALFPDAIAEDGVIQRLTNDIWVLRDGSWQNVGPTPGPRVVTTVVIPAFNETVVLQGVTGPGLEALSLPYALEVLTEADPIVIRLGATIRSSTAFISLPLASFGLAAYAPKISGGASLRLPASNTQVIPRHPILLSGVSLQLLPVEQEITPFGPAYVGERATVLQPPLVSTGISANNVSVASGSSNSIDVIDVSFAPQTPIIMSWGPDIITSIGNTSGEEAGPFNVYYRRRIVSATYSNTEMATACNGKTSATIYGMRILVVGEPLNQPLPGYAIGAKNTANSIISNNSGTSGGVFSVVKEASDEFFSASTFKEFIFTSPIDWTGGNFVFSWAWCQISQSFDDSGTNPFGSGDCYHSETDSSGCYTASSGATLTGRRPVIQLLSS
jgi:hypothetical protein